MISVQKRKSSSSAVQVASNQEKNEPSRSRKRTKIVHSIDASRDFCQSSEQTQNNQDESVWVFGLMNNIEQLLSTFSSGQSQTQNLSLNSGASTPCSLVSISSASSPCSSSSSCSQVSSPQQVPRSPISRQIKFHEYKGPPSGKRQQQQQLAKSSLVNGDSRRQAKAEQQSTARLKSDGGSSSTSGFVSTPSSQQQQQQLQMQHLNDQLLVDHPSVATNGRAKLLVSSEQVRLSAESLMGMQSRQQPQQLQQHPQQQQQQHQQHHLEQLLMQQQQPSSALSQIQSLQVSSQSDSFANQANNPVRAVTSSASQFYRQALDGSATRIAAGSTCDSPSKLIHQPIREQQQQQQLQYLQHNNHHHHQNHHHHHENLPFAQQPEQLIDANQLADSEPSYEQQLASLASSQPDSPHELDTCEIEPSIGFAQGIDEFLFSEFIDLQDVPMNVDESDWLKKFLPPCSTG